MEDPFILIKNDVLTSLGNASTLYESWKRILQTVTSAENEELQKTKEELSQILTNIEQDLEDLDDAVKAVTENPQKFNLTTRESNARKQFVDQTRRKVLDMKTKLEKPVKVGDAQLDRLALLEDSAGSSSPKGYQKPTRRENMMYSNSKFVEQEAIQQQILMQEQDQQLDSVMHTVLNIREIATTMNGELQDQTMLLDDLDEHVDRTSGNLQKAMRRMNRFIKQNEESASSCCIGILIIVLIIMLILKPKEAREKAAVEEMAKSPHLYSAHPSLDHLLPFHVALGAAGEDKGKVLHKNFILSLSESAYSFGEN
ncbi:Syntaxin-6 [Lobosporangium transversale]|nr:Syntaxin-6 [Lobosporangium transversale]